MRDAATISRRVLLEMRRWPSALRRPSGPRGGRRHSRRWARRMLSTKINRKDSSAAKSA